jgi:hypothetical protein
MAMQFSGVPIRLPERTSWVPAHGVRANRNSAMPRASRGGSAASSIEIASIMPS